VRSMGYSKNILMSNKMKEHKKDIGQIYAATRSRVDDALWDRLMEEIPEGTSAEGLPEYLEDASRREDIPFYLSELARLEYAISHSLSLKGSIPSTIVDLTLNPTLQILQFSWKGLPFIADREGEDARAPEKGDEIVLVWYHPREEKVRFRSANGDDLLPLKIVAEGIRREDVAKAGNVSIGMIDDLMYRAVRRGLLLEPPSGIRRDEETFPKGKDIDEEFFSSPVFTLQWHITQACDLHCKHCYDRSSIRSMDYKDAISIMDDLRTFCLERHVTGHISFTGGNPLMYPRRGSASCIKRPRKGDFPWPYLVIRRRRNRLKRS